MDHGPTALPVRADFNPQATDQELLEQVLAFYHQRLKEHAAAREFLSRRGLTHPELIDHFQLGFADRELGRSIPPKRLKAGQTLRKRLSQLGIYRDSGHAHFNGSLVIPIRNVDGRIAEVYGRKIGANLVKGTRLHSYLPLVSRPYDERRGVFNWLELREAEEVIVTDSILNALTFWSAGLRHVTCVLGTEGGPPKQQLQPLTEEQLEVLSASGAERFVLAMRRTDEGDALVEQVATQLAAIKSTYLVSFPSGQDANDYALEQVSATESLTALLRRTTTGDGPTTVRAKALEDEPEELTTEDTKSTKNGKPTKESTPVTSSDESPVNDVDTEVGETDVVITLDDRRYRVRGLEKNHSFDRLKVNLLVSRDGLMHVDTFDLYAARARHSFIKHAAREIFVDEETIKRDLSHLLLKLETLQEQQIKQKLQVNQPPKIELTEAERAEALTLLRDPNLLDRILADFDRCGLVGEETNKLVGYLATISRKLEQPLGVVIQSSSAAGKTTLMDGVLRFVPPEELVRYSALTGQSLYYMGQTHLKHKVLAIVEEAGAEQAAYALKLLQSDGELTIASTGKDQLSGRHQAQNYHVEGPVMLCFTTTAIDIDEELLNRCLLLTVDESREQTAAIHRQQRLAYTLAGIQAEHQRPSIVQLHRNAQRLLRPLPVLNPYAPKLTFLNNRTRLRRDHVKYLTLIRAITLLHQHQRELKTAEHQGRRFEYLEVTARDIALANRLADRVLGRSIDDLPPQTRRLLGVLYQMVLTGCEQQRVAQTEYRFTRRQLREYSGWSQSQIRVHLERLIGLEYVLPHRGPRGRQYFYELLYDGRGREGQPVFHGLIDAREISHYDYGCEYPKGRLAGPDWPIIGPLSAQDRGSSNDANPDAAEGNDPSDEIGPQKDT